MSLLAFNFLVERKQGDTLSSLLFYTSSLLQSALHSPPNSRMPVLIISQWKTRGWCEGGAGTPGRVIQCSPAEREKVEGGEIKFLFHCVIIALQASLSVLISVLQVCAVHVWSWKRAAVDGLKSGVWASHPVCIFWKTLIGCPNYGKY